MMKWVKVVLTGMVTAGFLYAQNPPYSEQILSNSGGDAVAMDKEWAVVGDAANNKVHPYRLDYSNFNWIAQNEIIAPAANTGFGKSISISGTNMLIGAPTAGSWDMEVRSVNIGKPQNTPIPFKDINFTQAFDTVPAVFILTGQDGNQPAAIQVKDVTATGFKAAILEPENTKNPDHNRMVNVRYLAIEKGRHTLPNGKILIVGEVSTAKHQGKNDASAGWETIGLGNSFTTTPVILSQTQTLNNQTFSTTQTEWADPWMTPAVDNVTDTEFNLALETSKTNTEGNISNTETIVWLAVEEGDISLGNNITLAVTSDSNVTGWGGGVNANPDCTTVHFTDLGSTAFVLAAKNDRIEADGGWVRRCSDETNKTIGLAIDENVDPNVSGDNRDHIAEKIGILAFSGAFRESFTPGPGAAYLYVFNGTDWILEKNITAPSREQMAFGSAVAIEQDINNSNLIHLAVGAPDESYDYVNGKVLTGEVYLYEYTIANSTLAANSYFHGDNYRGHKFASSIDMKGKYLIVGSPYEDGATASEVGAAYTYDFNGTDWVSYPSAQKHRIKINNDSEHFGTKVAINEDGNVTMMATDSASGKSYIFSLSGNSWGETYNSSYRDNGGVDIDDGVYLMAQITARLKFYEKSDGESTYPSPLNILRQAGTNAYTSVSLDKEFVLVNDPGNGQAVALTVPCGIKPVHMKAYVWEIVTAPCDTGSQTISDIFGPSLGSNYGTDWVMYEQTSSTPNGQSTPKSQMESNSTMQLGRSYWIISAADKALKVDEATNATHTPAPNVPFSGTDSAMMGDAMTFPLSAAKPAGDKVMLGNPYPRTVTFADIYYESDAQSGYMSDSSVTEVKKTAYVYNPSSTSGQPYDAVTTDTPGLLRTIKPYQGFFIMMGQSAANPKFRYQFDK